MSLYSGLRMALSLPNYFSVISNCLWGKGFVCLRIVIFPIFKLFYCYPYSYAGHCLFTKPHTILGNTVSKTADGNKKNREMLTIFQGMPGLLTP